MMRRARQGMMQQGQSPPIHPCMDEQGIVPKNGNIVSY